MGREKRWAPSVTCEREAPALMQNFERVARINTERLFKDGMFLGYFILLPFAPALYDQFDIPRTPVLAERFTELLPLLLLAAAYHTLIGHKQQRLWEVCDHAICLACRMCAHRVF